MDGKRIWCELFRQNFDIDFVAVILPSNINIQFPVLFIGDCYTHMMPEETCNTASSCPFHFHLDSEAPVKYVVALSSNRSDAHITARQNGISGISLLLKNQISILEVYVVQLVGDRKRGSQILRRKGPPLSDPVASEIWIFAQCFRRRKVPEVVVYNVRKEVLRVVRLKAAFAFGVGQRE